MFQGILDHSEQLIYDLSTTFSRSMGIRQAEKGYNKDKIYLPQINLALLCSADTGFPTMIRSVPGSVKDIKTLSNTIEIEYQRRSSDPRPRFFSEEVIKDLSEAKIDYVLPARRNSHYYDVRIHLTGHFGYRKRLIECGKRKVGEIYLYKFCGSGFKAWETKTLYQELDEGKIDKDKLREEAQNEIVLILSSKDMPVQGYYELYKKRERVEKLFDAYKNVLDADRLYLQDQAKVCSDTCSYPFLSLYAYCKLEEMLKGEAE